MDKLWMSADLIYTCIPSTSIVCFDNYVTQTENVKAKCRSSPFTGVKGAPQNVNFVDEGNVFYLYTKLTLRGAYFLDFFIEYTKRCYHFIHLQYMSSMYTITMHKLHT